MTCIYNHDGLNNQAAWGLNDAGNLSEIHQIHLSQNIF